MKTKLQFNIQAQPDDTTCGPTCLHSIYQYYGDEIPLDQLIREVPSVPGGGTLAVLLACHALERGYRATIYTYNMQVFDPTWFLLDQEAFCDRLRRQIEVKSDKKLKMACEAYLKFLSLGGRLRLEDLTPALIRRYLRREKPIITGCSVTYLYRSKREWGDPAVDDDVRGEPVGHFVVLNGYDRLEKTISVADPYPLNPIARSRQYDIDIRRALCAILLGTLTFDANLLILEPKASVRKPVHP